MKKVIFSMLVMCIGTLLPLPKRKNVKRQARKNTRAKRAAIIKPAPAAALRAAKTYTGATGMRNVNPQKSVCTIAS